MGIGITVCRVTCTGLTLLSEVSETSAVMRSRSQHGGETQSDHGDPEIAGAHAVLCNATKYEEAARWHEMFAGRLLKLHLCILFGQLQ